MRQKSLSYAVLIVLAVSAIAIAGTRSLGDPRTIGTDGIRQESAKTLAAPSSSASQSWTIAKFLLPGYTIRHTVPEVRFQFSVADERGRLVTTLSPGDFRIFDNQAAVSGIRQFLRLEGLPLQLGLLLDVSDSVQKSVFYEKLAAQFFLQRVLHPQTDRAFLMAFGRDVTLWQSTTGDPAALRRALDRVEQLGYATNLYDGLFSACAGQFPQSGEQDVVQRVIVLFSDGEDTGSLHGMPDVIAAAQRNEVQIFALAVHAKRRTPPGDEVLQRIAEETGGRFYVTSSEKEFPAIFAQMESEMRTQYSISFQPEQQTPGFHPLRVELTTPTTLRVHARQGYFFDAP